MFTQAFDSYVVLGDRIKCEVDGFTCIAQLHPDTDTKAEPGGDGYGAWVRDEWHYYVLAVTAWREGVQITHDYDHARWGIDGNFPGGDNSHFRDIANDFLPEVLADAKAKIAKWAREIV